MNISSVVIVARPDEAERVAVAVMALPGVEVHARTSQGRLAATLEDCDGATAAETYVRLHTLPGVHCVSLIYQYSDESTSEELPS
jgi:nitrate reductase NapD